MMKKYITPEAEIIKLSYDDTIATSGTSLNCRWYVMGNYIRTDDGKYFNAPPDTACSEVLIQDSDKIWYNQSAPV